LVKEVPVNVVLWFAQVLLALAFSGAGYDQAANYYDARRRLAWVGELPRSLALILGGLEILAAVGLILPALTGVMTWITPSTALALAALMAVAVAFHYSRHEVPQLAFSGFIGLVAVFVAIGRFFVVPL
jgi:hypothetical protein